VFQFWLIGPVARARLRASRATLEPKSGYGGMQARWSGLPGQQGAP